MRFDTIIKNATIVTAIDTTLADVGISGGKISAIAVQLSPENATQTIDASNHLLIPGGIDVHTHLDMPFGGTVSADDYEWGTRAAAIGGQSPWPLAGSSGRPFPRHCCRRVVVGGGHGVSGVAA